MRALSSLLVILSVGIASLRGAEKPVIRESKITENDREHWSFRPLKRPSLPKVSQPGRNPIDRFIRARLEKAGLHSLPDANRTTLIRRLSFSLTGLPPTPEQVQAFLNDASPDAYEKLVDRLLNGPAHGQRWAQHWLDLARFAETDGFEHDLVRKEAWRYRDWVIQALNRDLPYDKFVQLQIAGDEIQPDDNGTHVATGFLMSGPDMPDINLATERRHVLLNEMTSTVGSVFLGLTLECTQCHDHKFDPISQADFYRFRALFVNALPKLQRFRQHPMTIREASSQAPKAHLMVRGDFRRPGPVVPPAFPRIASSEQVAVPKPSKNSKSSQRRQALAQWLTQPEHPLTARVIVNRVWMHHFGRGLSSTPSDFGTMGEEPTHPELLDWLATELIRMDWSLKKLHRLIVTSTTYRRASYPVTPEMKKQDPNNKLWARRDRIRLDGEAIRDALLVAAGQLSSQRGGPGVMPPLPKELVETLLKNQWKASPNPEHHRRRSIYVFARRNLRFPIFEAFDRPDGNASCSRRSTSTTAPQALMLLNSKFTREMANVLAASVSEASTLRRERIRLCYRRILSRSPSSFEIKTAEAFLQAQTGKIRETRHAEKLALADFCLALLNLNEFVYVD